MSEERSPRVCLSQSEKKNTRLAFFLFLGIAALGVLALILGFSRPVIAQGITFISLIVAAYICVRYMVTSYRYEIVSESDGDYLLIVRVQGKRDFTQQKLPLSALTAIIEVNTAASTQTERPDLPVSNYSAQLFADVYTLLHFTGAEPTLLRINADEAFLTELAAYLPEDNTEEPENADKEAEND